MILPKDWDTRSGAADVVTRLVEAINALDAAISKEPAAPTPSAWKAREYDPVYHSICVERRPDAREWWRCESCAKTFMWQRQDHLANGGMCRGRGWSRVLEVERV